MRCILAIVLLTSALVAQTPEATATLSGVVKDSNGVPVAGLNVAAMDAAIPNLPGGVRLVSIHNQSTTDEAGNYTIGSLRSGAYVVRTERGEVAKRVTVADGDKAVLDFVIPADPSISGKVVDADDNPVVDAFVWLVKPAYEDGVLQEIVSGLKVTREDGSYAFESGIEVNRRYYILVDRPPDSVSSKKAAELTEREPIEVPTYYPSATNLESASTVILQPGENRTGVNMKIASAPFYCVEGKVLVAGKPAALNFAIHEAPLAGSRLARVRGYTGADGKYHACGLSRGAYRISFSQGFAEFTIADADVQQVDVSLDVASPRLQVEWDGPSVVPPVHEMNAQAEALFRRFAGLMGVGEPSSDDDRRKVALSIIGGEFMRDHRETFLKILQDPDLRADMGNLLTSLRPFSNPVMVRLKGIGSEFDGLMRENMPAGDYIVEVQHPADCYVKDTTYNDLKLSNGAWRLSPAETATLRIVMSKGAGELTVAVVDGEGKPVADATAIVVPDSIDTVSALNRLGKHGKTDQNGVYQVHSLAPGKYRVLATVRPIRWDVPEDLEKVRLLLFQAQGVEVDGKTPGHISPGVD